MRKRVTLTPELAAKLLANPYPRQRKMNPPKVAEYSQVIRGGMWRDYNPEAILLDRTTGQLFDGIQRCSAVVRTGISINVVIDDENDADLYFDVVGIPLTRNAAQFITSSRASVRAGAARVALWHEQAFDQPLSKLARRWQLHEILAKADELDKEFETWIRLCDAAYLTTRIATTVMLAASVIAARKGYSDELQEFLEKLIEPAGLDLEDPAYILHRKMNNAITFRKRREPQQDWLLFVRCLNASINDDALPAGLHSNVSVWPDIGDSEDDIRRKIARAAHQKSLATKIEKRIRARVEAEMAETAAGSMAASSR